MSHSVSRHLRLAVDEYDATIRRFIRGYEAMLDAAVKAVLGAGVLRRVVDLGAGTGALAERLLARHPTVTVELWDIDAEMLAQAGLRLAGYGKRAVCRDRSFSEPLDGADAAMASLALHHVREADDKAALYRSIASGLRPGGVFANADVTIPSGENEARSDYRAWADHLVASGIEESQAWRHFDEWADEDRYFSLDEELAMLTTAGLAAECHWRLAPSTVVAGTKPG